MMTNLSVILPIYNVEDYLIECLESIEKSVKYASIGTKIEIILVDDGSTDRSGEIAEEYAKKNNYIFVKKENGGLSDARNCGLEYATGEYVAFIDSDDKVTENYFHVIFQSLESNPDMIIFDWYDFFADDTIHTVNGMENGEEIWTVQPSAWNKIYRRSFFKDIKFPKGKVYEDVGTIYKIIPRVREFIYIEESLYLYRKGRQNSLLTTISPKINDIYDVLEDTYNYYSSHINNDLTIKDGLCYQYVKLLMWSNMYRQLKYSRFHIFRFYKKMKYTHVLINERFSDWKNCELIKSNPQYFIDRFGNQYIHLIDKMGENFLTTLYATLFLTIKNMKRR